MSARWRVVLGAVAALCLPMPSAQASPAGLGTDDGEVNGLWGPARRRSGDKFLSTARPQADGPFRLVGEDWSLSVNSQVIARVEGRYDRDLNADVEDGVTNVDHRARLGARASYRGRLGVVIELQDVRVWGSEANTARSEPLAGLHQGFVDLNVAEGFDVRVGRQDLCYGEDRLIGCLDWAQSGRAFDGIFTRWAPTDGLTLDGFGFRLRDEVRGHADRGDDAGAVFGGLYGRWRPEGFEVDVYALHLADDESGAPPGAPSRLTTLGARGKATLGPVAVTGEGAYQLGESPVGDVRAWAAALRAQYTAPIGPKLYVAAEGLHASGGDRSDGVDRTFRQLFPTGHIHLGYADFVGWQNVQSGRGTVGARPWGTHVWVDFHHLRLADPKDAWYDAAGRVYRPAQADGTARTMGNEIDVSWTVPVFEGAALAAAYALFLPGDAAPGEDTSHWWFLSLRGQL